MARSARATSPTPKTPTFSPESRHPLHEPGPALPRLRAICLALPETTEKIAWGEPTFRVGGKLFCMYVNDHHDDGREAIWCPAGIGIQAMAVKANPTRYFVPPYVGPRGWIGLRLDVRPSWRAVTEAVHDAYRIVAPKRLAARLAAG